MSAFFGGDHSFTIHLSACLGGDHSFTIHLSAFLGGCSASSRGPGGRILALLGAMFDLWKSGLGPPDEGLEVESLYFVGGRSESITFSETASYKAKMGWDERTEYRIHCVLRRVSLLDD